MSDDQFSNTPALNPNVNDTTTPINFNNDVPTSNNATQGVPQSAPAPQSYSTNNDTNANVNPNTNTSGTSDDTKTLVTVLVLIFFYPLGVILMWVWTSWKIWVKALITGLGCLSVLLVVVPFVLGLMNTVNPQLQFQKAEDAGVITETATVYNALLRYQTDHNGQYPWMVESSFDEPAEPGKTGTPLSTADWLTEGPKSLVGLGELTDKDYKESLSGVLIFWDEIQNSVILCFEPQTPELYVPEFNKYGLRAEVGTHYCIDE